MLPILEQQSGTVFVGFTGDAKCLHCNNITPFQIRQSYTKQALLMIPIGTKKGGVVKVCPVCEKKESIMLMNATFTSDKKLGELVTMLEGGKERTKQWIRSLNPRDKEEAFKRLNALKAYSLVKYCAEIIS